jgi:CelD/BcsL family acetyltransferase involved in cellulose biosynthesis
MHIRRIQGCELDAGLATKWQRIVNADPQLASPYFSPRFVQLAAMVCPHVEVGVLELDGRVCGFFPYQRIGRDVAGPVGGRLSDYHGAIVSPAVPWQVSDLMRACGLAIWDFDHVPAAQTAWLAHARVHTQSPIMNLSAGYDSYLEQRKHAGAQRVAQFLRKARKFEREQGALRFEADSRDRGVMAQLVQWKREQCLRTGVTDFMAWGWTTQLLDLIWAENSPDFSGRLSALWHGETLLGAHFGMNSATASHWWLPTYNHDFSDYSPGGILLLRVAQAAAQAGLQYLDLGKGDDVYKSSFATGAIDLIEGSVQRPSLSRSWREVTSGGRAFAKGSPWLAPARSMYRQIKDRQGVTATASGR